MLFDAFKIVVWLIERYNLHEKVRDHLSKPEDSEAVMVQTSRLYVMDFDEPLVTQEELLNKIKECTEEKKHA